jgi:cyanophycin synthetase
VGAIAAGMFDDLVFRERPDARGRPAGEVLRLLREGALSAGFPSGRIHQLMQEPDATEASLRAARPGDLVVLLPTEVEAVWKQVMDFDGVHAPFSADQVQGVPGE